MIKPKNLKEVFLTDNHNRKIACATLLPKKIIGQVVIVHGLSEHIRCYYSIAEEFAKKNIAVHMMDLPGHGLSEGKRGHIDFFQEYIDNLAWFMDANQDIDQSKPLFLVGHSLGGLISIFYALQTVKKIDGLILSSPLTGLPAIQHFPLLIFTKFFSKRYQNEIFVKPFTIAALCRDKSKWDSYQQDPYRLHNISPQLAKEMLKQIQLLEKNISLLKLPLLIFYSAKDKVVSPDSIQDIFKMAGSSNKTLIAFSEAMHELFQEKEKDQMMVKILNWIKET